MRKELRENVDQNLPSVGGSSVKILTSTLADPCLEYLHVISDLNALAKVIGCPGESHCAVLEKSK